MQRSTGFRAYALALPIIALSAVNTLSAQQPKDRVIEQWAVKGTFPVDTGQLRVRHDYLGGESAAEPDASWRIVKADSLGRINFNNVFTDAQRENAAAYGFVYVTAPADRTINISVETDDDGVVWLNGALVYYKEVARGVGEADTVTLRFAKGVNRLLYKAVNRSGGFGLRGKLLGNSADRIDDLTISASRPQGPLATGPSPFVTLGTPHLRPQLVLQADGQLMTTLQVDVTRWGTVSEPLSLVIAGRQVAAPASSGSLPSAVELRAGLADLANAIRKGGAGVQAKWGKLSSTSNADLRAGDLLSLLSVPITLEFAWSGREQGTYQTTIPPQLAGLTLAADVAEFLPGATITVNNAPAEADALQQIVVCNPCKAGAPLRIDIRVNGKQWWDSPRLFVRDFGWRELVESARYARIITGDSTIALPADSSANKLLGLLGQPDKHAYHAQLDQLRAPQRTLATLLQKDTIDEVGNSHIDAAWLWRVPETIEVVRNTWRTAVKLLDKYPEMKFAASAGQYYVWLEQYEPELLAKIKELVQQGRWIPVGGMWVESDVNLPTGESLARQLLYGQRSFMRLLGKYAEVGWIPDTFGYPWQLPQIFELGGLNTFITQKLRWNDTNHWTADRNYFIWQGRDGTGMPTYIPFGYDHDLNATKLAREFRAQADSAATRRLVTLYGVGDHGGGPTMQMLDRRRESLRVPAFPVQRDVDPAVSLAAMAREAPKPPVIDDELYFEYHRGVQTTQAAIKQWNRRMEGLLIATDAAAALAPDAADRKAIQLAWQKTLFNQFHDILPGSGIGPVYDDAKVDYRSADSIATGALTKALHSIAARLDTRAPKGTTPVFVFNPSGHERNEMLKLVNAKGDSVPLQVTVPPVGGTIVFVPDQPPVFRAAKATGAVLENDSLRVEIDPATGNIARLFDKRLQHEIVQAGAQANALMLMADNPADWDAWNIDQTTGPWLPVRDSVQVGPVVNDASGSSITVRRGAPGLMARQRYVLPRNGARLDIENHIEWHASHQLLKAFFPLAVHADSVWAEIAFGAIGRPSAMKSRKDSARFELPMHRWIDASQNDWGVSLVNDAKYGYDVRGDTLRLSLLRAPKWPDPNADMGTHTFRYSIVPHRGTWRSGATWKAADELNRPLRALPVTQHAGTGRSLSMLSVEGEGFALSGLKLAEESGNWIVRVVANNGVAGNAIVNVPGKTEWRLVDFVERPHGEWQKMNGRIEVAMRPWEVVSLEVR